MDEINRLFDQEPELQALLLDYIDQPAQINSLNYIIQQITNIQPQMMNEINNQIDITNSLEKNVVSDSPGLLDQVFEDQEFRQLFDNIASTLSPSFKRPIEDEQEGSGLPIKKQKESLYSLTNLSTKYIKNYNCTQNV